MDYEKSTNIEVKMHLWSAFTHFVWKFIHFRTYTSANRAENVAQKNSSSCSGKIVIASNSQCNTTIRVSQVYAD